MTIDTESIPSFKLLRFGPSLFSATAPYSSQLIDFLTEVINRGYNINKQYNVITSTRIKSPEVFINDLGFYKPESFLLVLVKEGSDGEINADVFKRIQVEANKVEIEDVTTEFDPEKDIKTEDVLGTIGGKLYDASDADEGEVGWELTGVTSFARGCGSYLIGVITKLAEEAKKDFLYASVIFEHGLVGYYSRFGFVECQEKLLQQVDATGRVIGGDLEDGIYATRDFHVAFLKKQLIKR